MNLSAYTTGEIREELARRKTRRMQTKSKARLMLVDGKELAREVKEREAREVGGHVGECLRDAQEKKSKRSVGVSRGDGKFKCFG